MEIVPGPDKVHVTAVLEGPLTVAVNCCPPLGPKLTVEGERETDTGGLRVTFAVLDFVVSATLVAVTVAVAVEVMVAGAV